MPLYTGAVPQDLAVEQYSTWKDQCSTNHAMATCYGRIGDTSMSFSENHNMDANNYQADINDLENIEPTHQAGLRNLTCKREQLWQTIKANDKDPMDAISHLEHKRSQLSHFAHPCQWNPLGKF